MNEPIIPKPLVWILGIILTIFIALLGVGKIYDIAKQSKDQTQPKNTISISAEGKVQAVPDLATLSVSVITQGTGNNLADIENQNSKKVNAIIDMIKAQGIDKKDITSGGPNIQERRDYSTGGMGIIVGYDVSQTVTIKVHGIQNDTGKVSAIIAKATDNGANQLSGVAYSFEDVDSYREQAREDAVNKAKEKAADLAKTAGITLGRVVTISEVSSGYPQPFYGLDSGINAAPQSAMKSVAPTLEPGTQDITADMTVVFEVK